MVRTCNPGAWDVEAQLGVKGQLQLCRKLEASLGYRKPCLYKFCLDRLLE